MAGLLYSVFLLASVSTFTSVCERRCSTKELKTNMKTVTEQMLNFRHLQKTEGLRKKTRTEDNRFKTSLPEKN